MLTEDEQMFEEGQEREVAMKTKNNTQKRKKYRIKSKFRFITSMIIMFAMLVGGLNLLLGLLHPNIIFVYTVYLCLNSGFLRSFCQVLLPILHMLFLKRNPNVCTFAIIDFQIDSVSVGGKKSSHLESL